MIVFPNCKINLGLHIVNKREDGYHNIETIFYPIAWQDVLEAVPSNSHQTTLHITGNTPPGNSLDNSCVLAYETLKKDFPALPAIAIHLHKAIPAGAGLGGGSADGAFALQLFNSYFSLGLSQEQLINYALALGSDCPFFIINKPAIGKGRGEQLETINLSLSEYKIIVVNPSIHVNTGWAFSKITPSALKQPLKNIVAGPISSWKELLINDFEAPVFEQHPAIRLIKETMYQQGALYAAMSGSGSTVFGIFNKDAAFTNTFPGHYFVKQV
jgi:4-diphosphocytidyl-2-C-methyl-D-erythritol kinase